MVRLEDKIVGLNQLVSTVGAARREGKKIVTYNGSFDLIQIGHTRTIREAKEQGDLLVVFVNSDKSVSNYKGPHRPLIDQNQRAMMVAGIEGVDCVCIFDDINPKSVLAKIRPDVHCNGPEWGENCVERETVEKYGGRIYITKTERLSSTSLLIKKILDVYSIPDIKAIFINNRVAAKNGLEKLFNSEFKIIIYGENNQTDKTRVKADKFIITGSQSLNYDRILEAVHDFGISLNNSWLISDNENDVILGRETNIKTIKIGSKMPKKLKLEPNYYVKDFKSAVEIIIN